MKDMGEATYVIGIKIKRDRSQRILGLSQETYINKVLEGFHMKDCSPSIASIANGDRFSLNQCPSNDLERKEMKNIPYASTLGSLMYTQVCTRPDISYVVGMLGRYQSNLGLEHWKAAKKVMRYLRGLGTTSLHTGDLIIWMWLDIRILIFLVALILESRHLDTSSY